MCIRGRPSPGIGRKVRSRDLVLYLTRSRRYVYPPVPGTLPLPNFRVYRRSTSPFHYTLIHPRSKHLGPKPTRKACRRPNTSTGAAVMARNSIPQPTPRSLSTARPRRHIPRSRRTAHPPTPTPTWRPIPSRAGPARRPLTRAMRPRPRIMARGRTRPIRTRNSSAADLPGPRARTASEALGPLSPVAAPEDLSATS